MAQNFLNLNIDATAGLKSIAFSQHDLSIHIYGVIIHPSPAIQNLFDCEFEHQLVFQKINKVQ